MVIQTWSHPIHEHQEGEVARERTYLEQFFIFPGNLSEYSYFIDYVFNLLHSAKQPQTNREYDKIFHDVYHGEFEFDVYDLKKGKSPSKFQLEQWSKGTNCNADVKYTWTQIRTSFRDAVFSNSIEDVTLIVANALSMIANDTIFLLKQNKRVVQKEIDNDTYTANKSESAAKAQNVNTDTLMKVTGRDRKEVKADVNMNADVVAETEVKTELQNDLEKVQEQILSPSFAEVTRKLSTHLKDND